ncbi:hypothetical protein [Butyricimonas virosa]|uniref:hypothetical protein n=1 Tax=Butyricimonas virosa TaxID=544645 RepID=UPI0011C1AF14|nr:hypothetical protein [Butyricimonas virosa]
MSWTALLLETGKSVILPKKWCYYRFKAKFFLFPYGKPGRKKRDKGFFPVFGVIPRDSSGG